MHITCPACGAVASLDAVLAHDAARAALVRALDHTPLGRRLVRYLALFRPAKRALSWERTAQILTELLDMVEAARITRDGRVWPAPPAYWEAALDEILARRDAGQLRTPLKSHGYLLEIIAGLGNRAEAQAERGREDRAAGRTPTATPPVGRQSLADTPVDTPAPRHVGPMPQTVRAVLTQIASTTGATES
jgi:hypothetical protein